MKCPEIKFTHCKEVWQNYKTSYQDDCTIKKIVKVVAYILPTLLKLAAGLMLDIKDIFKSCWSKKNVNPQPDSAEKTDPSPASQNSKEAQIQEAVKGFLQKMTPRGRSKQRQPKKAKTPNPTSKPKPPSMSPPPSPAEVKGPF